MPLFPCAPVTKEDFEQTLMWMRKTLRDILNDQRAHGSSDGYSGYVFMDLERYYEAIQVTPMEFATPAQHRAMRRIIEKRLPRMQRRLVRLFAAKDYYKAKEVTSWWLSSKMFDRIQAQATLHKHLPRVIEQKPQPQVAQVVQRPALEAKPVITFPRLSRVSAMVDIAVADLQQRWVRTNALTTLTTEDRFVVEQIATAYLPDSWRMFEGLRGLSPETVEEGENLLLSQVRDFTVRLDAMQEREATSSLQSLRAQTDFIEQTSPRIVDSHLDL